MNEDLLMDRINEALYPALEAALREGAWPPRPAVLIRRAYVNPPPPPPPGPGRNTARTAGRSGGADAVAFSAVL